MKILSRDFTFKEKLLLLILVVALIVLGYYQFIDKPCRRNIAEAQAEQEALQMELTAVNKKIDTLENMQNEINAISSSGKTSMMPSYNNNRNVTRLLNDVLGDLGYSITFSNVTREYDQIRRNISLQFICPDYESMEDLFRQLTGSEYRCLLDDVSGSVNNRYNDDNSVTVNATATFYETMVGGEADSGLPEDSAAAK